MYSTSKPLTVAKTTLKPQESAILQYIEVLYCAAQYIALIYSTLRNVLAHYFIMSYLTTLATASSRLELLLVHTFFFTFFCYYKR
jgi:hypothetical protein